MLRIAPSLPCRAVPGSQALMIRCFDIVGVSGGEIEGDYSPNTTGSAKWRLLSNSQGEVAGWDGWRLHSFISRTFLAFEDTIKRGWVCFGASSPTLLNGSQT